MYRLLPILLLLHFGRIANNIEPVRKAHFVEPGYWITDETFPDLSDLVRSDYFRDDFEQLRRCRGPHSDFFFVDSIQKAGIGYLFAMG